MNVGNFWLSKNRISVILILLILPLTAWAQTVELKNHSFYIDGKKFFVKGIGYEAGATPGKVPWARTFDAALLRFDIQRILQGGFNTIRTWAPFTAQELEVLKQYDIKIIMGIWIDPAGNFADKTFVNDSKTIVSDVLSYSKNYENIIGYLIMNEPLPETIARAGYDASVALWKELTSIIHAKHPGRPVSIANTCTGTYIAPDVFDFSAYNVYIYNPVTVNYLHGYRDYIQYLNQLNTTGSPLIITEYGLSVSPTGPGSWGYGGNSLVLQQEGDLLMYKALVDGGAAGSCIFNYSDGWWKGGNESVHNDVAEEWFGLVNYTGLSDQHGVERPVWKAVKLFQSAIITQPRSSEVYISKVPIEIFINDTIDRVEITVNQQQVYEKQSVHDYLMDTLTLAVQGMKEFALVFHCFDAKNNLVKTELKNILVAEKKIILPTVKISISNPDYWKSGYIDVDYQINRPAGLTSGSRLDYVFYPHVGFNYGEKLQWTMPAGELVKFSARHYFDATVNVITVGAAFDVSYNSFNKRIVNQLTVSRLNKIASSTNELDQPEVEFRIYPNPVSEILSVSFDNEVDQGFNYSIFNSTGSLVKKVDIASTNQPIDVSTLSPGVYYIRIELLDKPGATIKKVIKL
jgi:hypothetical protein